MYTETLIAVIQMKFARTCIALAAIIAPGSFSGQATPQPSQSEIDSADRKTITVSVETESGLNDLRYQMKNCKTRFRKRMM
jgi:hypothetical protein